MESTSIPNRIQASQKTADLLFAAGKGDWVTKRKDPVEVKGKGNMVTYWVEPDNRFEPVDTESESENGSVPGAVLSRSRLQHLINFNVEVLENLLKDLVAHNLNAAATGRRSRTGETCAMPFDKTAPRDEIVEVIPIPKLQNHGRKHNPSDVQLPQTVRAQIRAFVSLLANNHSNENPFHNFDHATHVAMSVRKLLARILKPLQTHDVATNGNSKKIEKILMSTYALTSDPMIQFAVYFSALIHDAQHPGVSNATLSQEGDAMAVQFNNKSCAEQNSVCVAWDLLMSKQFQELRACMFTNDDQVHQFRQLVVNAVMATDIFDRDLKSFRERRWAKAFPKEDVSELSMSTIATPTRVDQEGDLRATIVIEHIIQASDVVHTMQHWKVYQKWNHRLFCEMMEAYKAGRTDKDPATGWYKGELWFFDNYIIPLAKKLKECGVFGVSCDEVLDYALDNRTEWEQKGEEILAQWMAEPM